MDRIAILGSGFGLYGYLPALVGYCNKTVLLPERYREKFLARPELREFESGIRWTSDEYSALQESNGAVVALPPHLQEEWIPKILGYPNVQRLFLEKPLATTPSRGHEFIQRLATSGKVVRIAYIFRFLPWADCLRQIVSEASNETVTIRWHFQAYHHSHHIETWKKSPFQGGGPMRFYGIHLIALLAEFGYERVDSNLCANHEKLQPDSNQERWVANFTGSHRPKVVVEVDCRNSRSEFQVFWGAPSQEICLYLAKSPFGDFQTAPGELDPRVKIIATHCKTAWDEECISFPEYYKSTISLWQQAERVDPTRELAIA